MTLSRDDTTTRWILGQGRILEALAAGEVLTGTLDGLSQHLALTPDELRGCLREMVRRGWVAVQTQPFSLLTVRLERRSHRAPPPVTGERRRPVPNVWEL
jgi:hypothetical protein